MSDSHIAHALGMESIDHLNEVYEKRSPSFELLKKHALVFNSNMNWFLSEQGSPFLTVNGFQTLVAHYDQKVKRLYENLESLRR